MRSFGLQHRFNRCVKREQVLDAQVGVESKARESATGPVVTADHTNALILQDVALTGGDDAVRAVDVGELVLRSAARA